MSSTKVVPFQRVRLRVEGTGVRFLFTLPLTARVSDLQQFVSDKFKQFSTVLLRDSCASRQLLEAMGSFELKLHTACDALDYNCLPSELLCHLVSDVKDCWLLTLLPSTTPKKLESTAPNALDLDLNELADISTDNESMALSFEDDDDDEYTDESSNCDLAEAKEKSTDEYTENRSASSELSDCMQLPSRKSSTQKSEALHFDCFDRRHFQVEKLGDKKEVLKVTGVWRALFGCSKGWSQGVHSWRVSIDKNGDGVFGIGVSQNCQEFKNPTKKQLEKHGGWSQVSHPMFAFWGSKDVVRAHKGSQRVISSKWANYNEGASVQLVLDCSKWTLTAKLFRGAHEFTASKRATVQLEAGKKYHPIVVSYRAFNFKQLTVEFL